jgi:chemotaxis protein methyltransferase CheR
MQVINTMKDEAKACRYIIDLIYQRSGIRLHEGKEALIKARLGKRLRHLGFASLPEYCDFLQAGGGEEELERVTDALTTNFTGFLREESHFKFMVDEALPALLSPGSSKIRVWSAACSSGEEPYSIAFYLGDRYTAAEGWDWRITASDISTKMLGKARQGIYAGERVQGLPQEWLRQYFQKGIGPWEGHYRIKRSLSERVAFRQINLIEPYHHAEPFQIIFCRNVMIYFDRATQEQLVRRLCRFLAPTGCLLIGHSESLNGLNLPLRCLRPSIYQRSTV